MTRYLLCIEDVMHQVGKMKQETKKRVIFKIDIFLIVIQSIVAVLLGIQLIRMSMIPTIYMLLYFAIVLVLDLVVFFCAGKRKGAYVGVILSIIVTAILSYGVVAVWKLDKTLQDVSSDEQLETVQMSVYVRVDDAAEELKDLAGQRVGYVTDDEGAASVQKVVDEKVSEKVSYTDYEDSFFLADALLKSEERAIIMNSAYVDVIADQDGYEDFSNEIKEIYTMEVKVKRISPAESKKHKTKYELQSDENSFVVYISGIDMWGGVGARSRSDVNILAVVNTQTGKVQLINTPRDYYVYLPNQGANDKLTHAGLYGVESSVAALENLYGIKIDYYVRMNFSGFEAVINSLGGVDVYSTNDFTVDPIKHYKVGYNHLNGLEALAFARERHAFSNGDVQRGINQMEVIKAVIHKMTSPSILANYSDVLDDVSECVMTDVPPSLIYDLVQYQLAGNANWQIDSYTVTGTGNHLTTYSMPSTTCYVMMPNEGDVSQAKQLIEQTLAAE